MRLFIPAAVSLLILLMHTPDSTAQTYRYRNANGRIVETTQLPPGAATLNSQRYATTDNENNPGDYCLKRWGKNFEMIEYCVKKQYASKRNLYQYPKDILNYCQSRWADNFEMIEYCAQKQYSAKKRLGQ